MRLPPELRLIIWYGAIRWESYALPHAYSCSRRYLESNIDIREYVKYGDDYEYPMFLHSLYSLSKETAEEIVAVVIENSTFMVASFADNTFLQAFLGAVPGRLQLCRQLNFDYFGRFPGFDKNADLELAVMCSGLHTIELTFHYDTLTWNKLVGGDYYDEIFERCPRPVEELFDAFRLKRLLDCDMLQTVIIEHVGGEVDAAVRAAQGLGDLLIKGFGKKVPKQVVEVQYTFS